MGLSNVWSVVQPIHAAIDTIRMIGHRATIITFAYDDPLGQGLGNLSQHQFMDDAGDTYVLGTPKMQDLLPDPVADAHELHDLGLDASRRHFLATNEHEERTGPESGLLISFTRMLQTPLEA